MATTSVSEPRARDRVRRPSRALTVSLAALCVLLAASAILISWRIRVCLPQVDGTIRVPGLNAPVQVLRDARGVPHIRALSIEDALLAQGYVTAQDRLWQMDMSRRLAFGELSEILGQRSLKTDIENRTLGFPEVAEHAVENLGPADRAALAAYARGVNTYIETHRHRLPIEFALLGYQPRLWRPADSFAVALNMAKVLNSSWRLDLMRERVRKKVSPELYADLFPERSPLDHPVAEPLAVRGKLPVGPLSLVTRPWSLNINDVRTTAYIGRVDPMLRALTSADGYDPALGSNNWVVSGAHTASGKPLLANDPHLGHSIPSVWYMIHLQAPGLDVSGVSLPGAPSVIIGHNQRVAWGMTNTGPDVQDLFVEKFNPADPGQYLHDGQWVNAEARHEVIKVRGHDDYHLTVRVTRHGPVISPLIGAAAGGRELALEWTALQPHALTFPFFKMNEANNWKEFTDAIRNFTGPEQNMVYADVDGNIGYYAPAWVPVRKKSDGSVPVPGDTDDYDWAGYIPFEDLPHAYNPPGGTIATANSRVLSDRYPYFITHAWSEPWRTARIFQLLETGSHFTVDDMLRIDMDIHSLEDEWLAKQLIAAGNARPPDTPDARYALDLLRQWDGEARMDSAATLVCEVTRPVLLDRLLRPKLGEDLRGYEWPLAMTLVGNVLENHWTRWLPPGDADFNATLVRSLEEGVTRIPKMVGSDHRSAWTWGKTIPLTFHHPLGGLPLIGRFFNVGPFPQAGMATTVKATTMQHGPSMRMVVDFSDFDHSVNNITLGESGQLGSPYYKDQFQAWYTGRSFPMLFSDTAVDSGAMHRLRLEPAR